MTAAVNPQAPATPAPRGLRAAKKEQAAKKAPAKRVQAKAKATVTPIAKPEKVVKESKVYEATGRSGQTVRRKFASTATHGVCVADRDGRTSRAKQGQVWKLFSSEALAQAWATKMHEAHGYDCAVVPATEVVVK
ncbi:hypothetical protein MNAB215_2746 [Mycobacterium numidiamassiliense]|uniref:Uncharacterized protein n=1 Tax=Mycobacterium numidiamassiliense TaxID=1841861 RepID=A0A2U3PA33_9MYCO|nr:hypothetical protein [Mycobacterium numidiamassiliense]SPM40545.1 hypothetical protein MNAB215_2746 [Mycobacterium numidiamassiliense]